MSRAHFATLFVHSYLRWVLLALAGAVVARTFIGWRGSRPWAQPDERVHSAFMGVLHLQLVLGLLLYVFLSPITAAFLAAPRASLKVAELRFFGLEHIVTMLVAVAIAQAGRTRSRKIADPRSRHRGVFWTTIAALIVMTAAIPWPVLDIGRPLFRTTQGLGVTQPARPDAPEATCPPVYADRCASCHGALGRGDGPLAASLNPTPRSFAEPGWAEKRTDDQLRAVIREGGAVHGLSATMPPHSDLPDTKIQALVACVRSLGRAER